MLMLHPPVTLPTPTVSGWNTSVWTLTSPDGSQVERYIVQFECRVRNMTFVEKYMSVSASGGTGQVATSVSCFGGLGQLYRVKVWAVSGPNISPALVCTPDGQCREEGERHRIAQHVSQYNPYKKILFCGNTYQEIHTVGDMPTVADLSTMYMCISTILLYDVHNVHGSSAISAR